MTTRTTLGALLFGQILVLLLVLPMSLGARTRLDSLLTQLDATLAQRPYYQQLRQAHIDSIAAALDTATTPLQQYQVYAMLVKQYRSYRLDLAQQTCRTMLALAQEINNKEYIEEASLNMAEMMGTMGMFKEAMDILQQQAANNPKLQQDPYFLHIHHSLYQKMLSNTLSPLDSARYQALVCRYRDSLLRYNNPEWPSYALLISRKLIDQGQYVQALELVLPRYQMCEHDKQDLGMWAYELSLIYGKLGEISKEQEYLAISALYDIRRGVKSYIALRKLALLLYQQGQIQRAYHYIQVAIEDANFARSQFRTLEIAKLLPIINEAYDTAMQQERQKLIRALWIISLLTLVLALSMFWIYRQMNRLASARRSIARLYDEMKEINQQLSQTNGRLAESNKVKEAYIGSVFNLCSNYIGKMEAYGRRLSKHFRDTLPDQAHLLSGSAPLVADELKDFLNYFDSVFLSLYPNFVAELNALLLPGEQIVPKAGDMLSPELRVFALIKLGITDNAKIASFLHYSAQTVYNYKQKVRNKIRVSRDEFAQAMG